VSKAQFARYYLRSLEMAAKDEATPWFIPNDDKQVINLEHVLPQTPEQNWPEFNEEDAKAYARRIGNMALLLAKTNSDIQSVDFKTKKAAYKNSPYELTRMIAQNKTWTKDEIAGRQRALAELALEGLAALIASSSLGVWPVAISPTSFASSIGSAGRFGFFAFMARW